MLLLTDLFPGSNIEESEVILTHLPSFLLERLPKIDGVIWQVNLQEQHSDMTMKIFISAAFSIDHPSMMKQSEFINQVLNKAHQITCGGQIRLELES